MTSNARLVKRVPTNVCQRCVLGQALVAEFEHPVLRARPVPADEPRRVRSLDGLGP